MQNSWFGGKTGGLYRNIRELKTKHVQEPQLQQQLRLLRNKQQQQMQKKRITTKRQALLA